MVDIKKIREYRTEMVYELLKRRGYKICDKLETPGRLGGLKKGGVELELDKHLGAGLPLSESPQDWCNLEISFPGVNYKPRGISRKFDLVSCEGKYFLAKREFKIDIRDAAEAAEKIDWMLNQSIDEVLIAMERETIKRVGVARTVMRLGKFKIGDLVDSYRCEKDNNYMPGTGHILAIIADSKRPFICEHNNILYRFKKKEIEHTDPY